MVKLYEVWPGNNRFLCGCCVSGPGREIGGIIYIQICVLAIVIPFSIFLVNSNAQITVALPIVFFVLLALMEVFLIITSCSDPGIIPRRPFLALNKEKFNKYLQEQGNNNIKVC